jgi:hypothetical protein
LYAEDPNNQFRPYTGKILLWQQPKVPPTEQYPRFDTGVQTGSEISVFYDPLISKITTWAPTRNQAVFTMTRVLRETACLGLVTNKSFLLDVLANHRFLSGQYTTSLVDQMANERSTKDLGFDVQAFQHSSLKNLSICQPDRYPALPRIDAVPHRHLVPLNTKLDVVDLTLHDELCFVSALWTWSQRHMGRKYLHVPTGFRTLRYKGQMELLNVQLPGKRVGDTVEDGFAIEYVRLDTKEDDKRVKHFAMRTVQTVREESETVRNGKKIKKVPWYRSMDSKLLFTRYHLV